MKPFRFFLFLAGSLLALQSCTVAQSGNTGKSKTVLLDYYFNHEYRKDKSGNTERFHYTWEDPTNSGFSMWGERFRAAGAITDSLGEAPTAGNLARASVYIIVDADNEKETASPNYILPEHITAISEWVKKGGVLVLLANDSGNAEFKHFNQLANKFGIHFNEDRYHLVINNQYEQGAFAVPANHPLLPNAKKIFLKELSTLTVKKPAKSVFTDNGHVIMAVSDYGKGKVLAIGDPWIYNEYIDGKRLPAEFENPQAATDLANWLLKQSK